MWQAVTQCIQELSWRLAEQGDCTHRVSAMGLGVYAAHLVWATAGFTFGCTGVTARLFSASMLMLARTVLSEQHCCLVTIGFSAKGPCASSSSREVSTGVLMCLQLHQ
jgi:hypothetical protein